MSLCVGMRCKDGIAIASDKRIIERDTRAVYDTYEKLHMVEDRAVWCFAGCTIIAETPDEIKKEYDPIKLISQFWENRPFSPIPLLSNSITDCVLNHLNNWKQYCPVDQFNDDEIFFQLGTFFYVDGVPFSVSNFLHCRISGGRLLFQKRSPHVLENMRVNFIGTSSVLLGIIKKNLDVVSLPNARLLRRVLQLGTPLETLPIDDAVEFLRTIVLLQSQRCEYGDGICDVSPNCDICLLYPGGGYTMMLP